MENTLTPALSLYKQAWKTAFSKNNIWLFLFLGVMQQVGNGLFGYAMSQAATADEFSQFMAQATQGEQWIVWGLAAAMFIVMQIVIAWFTVMSVLIFDDVAQDKSKAAPAYLRWYGIRVFRVVFTNIKVFFLSLLGFLLLIIPGIFISLRLTFSNYVAILDPENVSPIKESWKLIKGKMWPLLGRLFINSLGYLIPYMIFSAVHTALGMVWGLVAPITGYYVYLVYRDYVRISAKPLI